MKFTLRTWIIAVLLMSITCKASCQASAEIQSLLAPTLSLLDTVKSYRVGFTRYLKSVERQDTNVHDCIVLLKKLDSANSHYKAIDYQSGLTQFRDDIGISWFRSYDRLFMCNLPGPDNLQTYEMLHSERLHELTRNDYALTKIDAVK